MGLFKKKEEKKVYLPTAENRDSESEAAKLKALEASLEFLNNPKVKEENNQKKTDEEKTAEVSEEKREETPDDIQTEQEADTKAEEVQNTALTSTVKANPVAPAVQPPSGKTLNPNAANQNTEDKKPDTAPVPKQTEPAEDKPATSMASKQWGRRMDYKTAVVKPQSPTQEEQPPVKPLAPTSVSNVPPAPRMPSNSLHTLNSQNSQNRLAQQQAAQRAAMVQRLEAEEAQVKKVYPTFDLEKEAGNPDFAALLKRGRETFTARYGPLRQVQVTQEGGYNWVDDPWPWEYAPGCDACERRDD